MYSVNPPGYTCTEGRVLPPCGEEDFCKDRDTTTDTSLKSNHFYSFKQLLFIKFLQIK